MDQSLVTHVDVCTLSDEQITVRENTLPPLNLDISRIMDIPRFSSLDNLLRCTAYVMRFAFVKRDDDDPPPSRGPLSASEVTNARLM